MNGRLYGCIGLICAAVLYSHQGFGQPALQPPYDASYSLTDLGPISGVPTRYGGLTFKAGDPNTLLIGGDATDISGQLFSVGVLRGTNNHIVGFKGAATQFAVATDNDGGVAYGPGGVLFLARWPDDEVGQTRPGSTNTDKIIDLSALGIGQSPGGVGLVPPGFPGAGNLKIMGFLDGSVYTGTLLPDGAGTYNLTNVTLDAQIQGSPEGFIYVPPGSPRFSDFGAMLVCEYQAGAIASYQINANGTPIPNTRSTFINGLGGPEGAAIDPVTGDFFFSLSGGTNTVMVVRGFNISSSSDLSINGSAAPSPVYIGSNLTYSITVTNQGPGVATAVVVTAPMSSGATFVNATSSTGTCTNSGGTVTCILGTLTNGAVASITLVVVPIAPGTLTNVFSIAGNEPDPVPFNNVLTLTNAVRPTACSPPPMGLVAWWPGDGTANDLVGINQGTLQTVTAMSSNTPSFMPGEVGSAFSFDGIGAYMQAPDSDLWAFGINDFTVEFWVNFRSVKGSSIGQPGAIFIGNDEGSGNLNKWFFALGGGVLNFHVNNPNAITLFLAQAPFSPVTNKWYHLAAGRSGNVFSIFVNGVAVGAETNSVTIPNPNAPLTIGQAESLGFVDGLIDEVSVYNRALAPGEIQAIYNFATFGKCKVQTSSGRPPLAIGRDTNGNVILSWPATFTGFTLQSVDVLSASNHWVNATGSAGIVAGRFATTNRPSAHSGFYRLFRAN